MRRREFVSALLLTPFVAKDITKNIAASEEISHTSVRDLEWQTFKSIEKTGFNGFEYRMGSWSPEGPCKNGPVSHEFIEYDIHPFGKVKTMRINPSEIDYDDFPDVKENSTTVKNTRWKLFDKDQIRAILKK